ncbi:preprotein translocase subunit YajC [Treponema putidum]|uniref:preprotein translocase subunit YajC n=1 Tax=Treponema putidum TaxID=221027 RepID=UPI0004F8B447|nr:preprotein translocase subunit YajC [Treponema putidum]AIN93942.1 preprotein translocase subunit YajC [Treponema putidum]TWI78068.1 preprotein translocase subunit YajC [Treponema putidum]
MNFIPLLQGASQGGFSSFGFLIPMLLVFVIFYFLLIRPQKKEQQKTEKMISQLQKGDKIITIGGIHGVVSSTKEKTLVIKVDDNCKIEINRSAVGTVLKDTPSKPDFAGEEDKKKPLFGKKADDSQNDGTASQNESK